VAYWTMPFFIGLRYGIESYNKRTRRNGPADRSGVQGRMDRMEVRSPSEAIFRRRRPVHVGKPLDDRRLDLS